MVAGMIDMATENENPTVLLVSDDRGTTIVLRALLESLGARVLHAPGADDALAALDETVSWVVLDPDLAAAEREDLVAVTRCIHPRAETIVLTESRDIEGVLGAMGYA